MKCGESKIESNYVLCLWVQFNCRAIHLDAILLTHLKLNTQHILTLNHSHKCMVNCVKNQCETGIGHWHSNRNEFKRLQTLARTYNELNLNEPQSIEPATSNAVVVVHLHFICIWNSRQRSVIFFLFKRYFCFFINILIDRHKKTTNWICTTLNQDKPRKRKKDR